MAKSRWAHKEPVLEKKELEAMLPQLVDEHSGAFTRRRARLCLKPRTESGGHASTIGKAATGVGHDQPGLHEELEHAAWCIKTRTWSRKTCRAANLK